MYGIFHPGLLPRLISAKYSSGDALGIKEILAVAVILFAYIQVTSEAKISLRIRSENTYHLYRSYMAVLSVRARMQGF